MENDDGSKLFTFFFKTWYIAVPPHLNPPQAVEGMLSG